MICKTGADESVGSGMLAGKTVVAVIGILAAIQSGYQAALMSPTEVGRTALPQVSRLVQSPCQWNC